MQKFVGRERDNQLARFHKRDAGAEKKRFAQIVSDEDYRFSQALLQGQEFTLQFGAGNGIERAERFVHEKKRRVGGQGAGHADSLPLSAGQFARIARRELRFKADELQQFCDAVLNAFGGPSFDLRDDSDVARDREMREEADFLDDVADHAAQADYVPVLEGAAVHEDGARALRDADD